MKLPFKPHLLALLCSAGLLAASGVLFVKSRAPDTISVPPAPLTQQPAAPAPVPVAQPAPVIAPTYTPAQIDQWTAPIALYPDALLSQILMASTYPSNVIQAAQWSKDNPKMQGDAAIQAVSGQPWDPSVKSLVAFPQLMSLMGQNPPWIESLGDAFLAQPKDVMDSVQRLRVLAQQTGALQSTPQQTVTTENKAASAPAQTTNTATVTAAAPAQTIVKIESADPQVVYVPAYNPNTVYGTWPNTSYPPVYVPPSPGEAFSNSLVKGLGFGLGVATTYAIFSNIDWDDDDDWDHHHGDDNHHDNNYSRNGDNNININVDNFNKISGQNLNKGDHTWQHNPAYREGVPYPNSQLNNRFHSTHSATGLSTTQQPRPANRDSQRQAAMAQVQQSTGKTLSATPRTAGKDAQRQAANQQLKQISQRNNYRGYDDNSRPHTAQRKATKPPRETRQASPQRRDNLAGSTAHQRVNSPRANALSGNDSRSANWQAQQQRGSQSLQQSSRHSQPRQMPATRNEHRELRHR